MEFEVEEWMRGVRVVVGCFVFSFILFKLYLIKRKYKRNYKQQRSHVAHELTMQVLKTIVYIRQKRLAVLKLRLLINRRDH